MADIVGFLGYKGQSLAFVDDAHYALIQGNTLCISDLEKGPREMILRCDTGISCFASHPRSGLIALAPIFGSTSIEIMRISTQQIEISLGVPTSAPLIDIAFSRNGDCLYAISDASESLIMCWEVSSGNLRFSSSLGKGYKKVIPNPVHESLFAVYGHEGIVVGTITNIMGSFSVRFDAVVIEPEFRYDEADISPSERQAATVLANTIPCAVWTPFDFLLIGNLQGNILEVAVVNGGALQVGNKSTLKRISTSSSTIYATCMILGSCTLILGTSIGIAVWFPTHSFYSKPTTPLVDCSSPLQTMALSGHISTVALDPSLSRLIMGTFEGEAVKVNVEVQELAVGEPNEEDAYDADVPARVEGPVLVMPEPLSTAQTGAILCTASMTIPNNTSKKQMSVFAVGSQSGTISFWLQPFAEAEAVSSGGIRRAAPRKMTLLSTIEISANYSEVCPIVCSMTPLPFKTKRGGQMLCIGLDNGWIEVWEISAETAEDEDEEEAGGTLRSKRIATRRFFNSPTTSVTGCSFNVGASSQGRNCITASSRSDSCVYVIEVFNTMDGCTFDVVTVIKLDESILPTCVLWNNAALWVGGTNGQFYRYSVDTIQPSSIAADLIFPAPELSCKTESSSATMQFPSIFPGDRLVGAGFGSSSVFSVALEGAASAANSSAHSDVIVTSVGSLQYFATGCVDGSVYLWNVAGDSALTLANRMQLHAGPILTLCFSADSSLLLSTSADGSYFLTTVGKAKLPEPKLMKLNEMGTSDVLFTVPNSDPRTWMEQKQEALLDGLKKTNESSYNNVNSTVLEISTRLQQLLDANAERSELEQMERAEFVVDIVGEEALHKDNQRRAENVRNSYFQLNSFNELIAARVRQTCWDSMAVQSRCLLPLLGSQDENILLFLSSLPIRKCSDEEMLVLERIKRLRAIEVRSQLKDSKGSATKLSKGKSRVAWSSSVQGCPETLSWLAFDGLRWPCADIIEMIAEKEKADAEASKGNKAEAEEEPETSIIEDEDSQVLDAERDVDDNDVFNLLYPPQSVRTQVQKRVQIALLKEIGRIVRAKFNGHFDRLAREKEDVMSSVESRNARIRIILDELKQQDEYLDPKWSPSEIAGAPITVRDDEIVSRPYESEAQRAARLKEEEDRRRREAEKDAEDVKGRALEEMMHGTLEIKRDVFAEASSMQRPEWMDVTPASELTDAQLKEIEAFEARFKALQEEQAKYRKTLEVELDKLKAESVDVCRAFDEKLATMAKLKVEVQRGILAQEVYVARIAHGMSQREEAWQLLKKNESMIVSTRDQRSSLRAKIDSFSSEVERVKNKLNIVQEEERTMEKGFKRDIQTLCNVSFDQDQLRIFSQLYRIRSYPECEDEEDEAEESEVIAGSGAVMGASKGESKSSRNKSASKKSASMAASGAKKGKAKASRGGASASGADILGPMQAAAQALNGDDQEQVKVDDRDPFYAILVQQEKAKKVAAAAIPIMSQLSLESDCPEGFDIDQFQWSKLQELRNARIEKEIEGIILTREYNELKQKFDQLCSEESIVLSCLKDLNAIKDETTAKLQSLESNLIVVISAKQGQDEVDSNAVVTDYSRAALVPVEVIRKFNGRIKEHGKEKIGVLHRIKQFRRKINILDWEAQHLNLESHHYDEYFTDLQLLRVTRDLQQVIREGSNAEQTKVSQSVIY